MATAEQEDVLLILDLKKCGFFIEQNMSKSLFNFVNILPLEKFSNDRNKYIYVNPVSMVDVGEHFVLTILFFWACSAVCVLSC